MPTLRERAESADERGNFEEALRLWNKIAVHERGSIDYCRAGLAAYHLGRWNDACDAYQQALNLDSACVEAIGLLGQLFRKRTDGDKQANLRLARDWYLQALHIEPKAQWFTLLGCTNGELKDFAAATEAFEEALRVDPKYEEAYLNLALLNIYEYGNPRLARRYLKKAISIDPHYAEAIFHLALLSKRREPKKARELLEKAIEADPDYAEAQFNLALLYQKKNPRKSRALLGRAIEINPNYGEAHQELGYVLNKERNLIEAEYHFKRCLEINPKDFLSYLLLADLFASQGRNEEAEKMYRAALVLPEADGPGFEFFAKFLDSLSRHEEANRIRARKPAG
jgi:tetratricopeptide (TPR) repeat protein